LVASTLREPPQPQWRSPRLRRKFWQIVSSECEIGGLKTQSNRCNTAFSAQMFAMPATCIHNEKLLLKLSGCACLPPGFNSCFRNLTTETPGLFALERTWKVRRSCRTKHPVTFSVSAFTYIQRSRRVFPVAIGLHRGKKGSRRVRFGEKTSLRSCAGIGTRTKFSGGSR